MIRMEGDFPSPIHFWELGVEVAFYTGSVVAYKVDLSAPMMLLCCSLFLLLLSPP